MTVICNTQVSLQLKPNGNGKHFIQCKLHLVLLDKIFPFVYQSLINFFKFRIGRFVPCQTWFGFSHTDFKVVVSRPTFTYTIKFKTSTRPYTSKIKQIEQNVIVFSESYIVFYIIVFGFKNMLVTKLWVLEDSHVGAGYLPSLFNTCKSAYAASYTFAPDRHSILPMGAREMEGFDNCPRRPSLFLYMQGGPNTMWGVRIYRVA